MEADELSNVRIIHGDSLEAMKSMPDKAYELAIVDPDFGLNEKISNGGTWASKYKKGDGDLGGKPPVEYWNQLFRISVNQIVWGGNYFQLRESRCFIVWDKIAQMDTLADCEMAWTSFDRNAKIYRHPRNTSEKRIHICQKPVALYQWLLKNYAKPGDKILDTHGGSCSIAIACDIMGFDATIYEIDEDYYKVAVERFERHKQQQVLEFG
jgi:site-specific DNA-methyltransferase (adenine-specific)